VHNFIIVKPDKYLKILKVSLFAGSLIVQNID